VKLKIDDHGLLTETDLHLTQASRDMFEDIDNGNYSQMSFSFVIESGGDHYEEYENSMTRVIDRIAKVYDISAVAFPANPGTDIGVAYRDLFNGAIESRKAERLKAIKERTLLKIKMNRR
jgi:HK97 family phage prohead protease